MTRDRQLHFYITSIMAVNSDSNVCPQALRQVDKLVTTYLVISSAVCVPKIIKIG